MKFQKNFAVITRLKIRALIHNVINSQYNKFNVAIFKLYILYYLIINNILFICGCLYLTLKENHSSPYSDVLYVAVSKSQIKQAYVECVKYICCPVHRLCMPIL